MLGFGPNVLGTLWGYLQEELDAISLGVQYLFGLHVSDAFGMFFSAFDMAVVAVPGEIVVGSMMDLGL